MADTPKPKDLGRYTGGEVKEVAQHYWDLMPMTRQQATDARDLIAGKLGVELPATVTLAGSGSWISDIPHKRTTPQKVRQGLIAKKWAIERPVTGGGDRARSVATRIAQPTNAIMKHPDAGAPWDEINDLLLIEGVAFSTVNVDAADWRKSPLLYPLNAPGLSVEHMDARYAVDAAGRFRGDTGYDPKTVDMDRARREHTAEKHDHFARHLPFRQRAYGIRQCAPIWGSDLKLEGLVIRTNWSVNRLRREKLYVSKRQDGRDAQLYPLGAVREGDSSGGATGRPVEVTEIWALDDENQPYITYCIDGWESVWKAGADGLDEHVIDLGRIARNQKTGEWQGFSRLPISWGWGLGWSTADPDGRAMPFTLPFAQSWRNIDALLTAVVTWAQWRAFPILIEKVSIADLASPGEVTEKDRAPSADFLPMKITQVTGDVTELGTADIASSVFQAVGIMMGNVQQEQPGGQQGPAPSGFAQTIAEASAQDALTTIHTSALGMLSQNASYIVEGAKFLGECYGEPIRVYQIADVLLEQEHPSDTEQMLVLDPALIGSSFDVKAVTKKVPGENPAVRQQNAALVKEGFYSTAWFLKEDGYPAPEAMAREVQWDNLVNSEAGQQVTMRMLSQYVSSKFVDQIQEAIAAGQANPQGLPVGFGDGTSPPPEMAGGAAPGGMLAAGPQATGGMDGLTVGSPAASSLAGQVGAAMQTGPMQNAIQAGGQLPATPLQGVVR